MVDTEATAVAGSGSEKPTSQHTLEGAVLLSREDLRGEIRRALREELPRPGDNYKGDAWWLERRRHVQRILDSKIAVGYAELSADLWWQSESGIYEPVQFERARRRFIRADAPKDPMEPALFAFHVPGKGTGKHYLARLNEAHCAVLDAVLRVGMKDKRREAQIVRRLREQYGATDEAKCVRCQRDAEAMAR